MPSDKPIVETSLTDKGLRVLLDHIKELLSVRDSLLVALKAAEAYLDHGITNDPWPVLKAVRAAIAAHDPILECDPCGKKFPREEVQVCHKCKETICTSCHAEHPCWLSENDGEA